MWVDQLDNYFLLYDNLPAYNSNVLGGIEYYKIYSYHYNQINISNVLPWMDIYDELSDFYVFDKRF